MSARFAAVKQTAQRAVAVIESAGLSLDDFPYKRQSFAVYLYQMAAADGPIPYKPRFQQATESSAVWTAKRSPLRDRILALEGTLMPLMRELRDGVDGLVCDCNSRDLVREKLGRSLLLAQLGAEVRAVSAERNLVMINETAALVHRLVTGNDAPFIYEKVGNAYARYMIDEFQDTSEKQWQNFVPLLDNALAENSGEPVMLIGDVKQSIYRWRGGNWRILGSEAETHFADVLAAPVPMETNWRSERRVIEFNNGLRRRVIEHDAANLAGFLAAAPRQLQPLADILSHSYEGFEQKPAPGKLKREPEGYVEVIPALREQIGPLVVGRVADLLGRGYALRDIAVLVRTNGEARRAADVLLEAGYAIVSQEALLLSGSPVVDFVMAIYALAAVPEDSVARAQYNAFLERPYGQALSTEEQQFMAGLLRCALTESFERILARYSLGVRSDAVSYLQALYQVIISYSKQTISDISLLLEWWRENGGKKTVYLPSEQDAITIMTVHKAKGLEFPCVMIAFCGWEFLPQANGSGATLWVGARGGGAGGFGLGPPGLLLAHLAAAFGLLGLGGHHGLLLLEPLLVVAFVGVGAPGVHLEDPLGDVVEEVAVVRHHDEGALELLEEGLDPGDGFGVEVVGGLVEEEDVGVGDEQAAHGDAALLAAGEVAGLGVRGGAAEGLHGQLHLMVEAPEVVGVDDLLEAGHLLLGAGLVEAAAKVLVALEHGLGLGHALHDAFLDGLPGVERGLLGQVADLGALGHLAGAHVVFVEAGEDLEEGGFAGAVGADDADVRAVEEGEVHVVEDDLLLLVLGDVLEVEDVFAGHGGAPFVRRRRAGIGGRGR